MRAGPFRFGTTESLLGVWQILARLAVLGEWATTTYKHWFETEILTRLDGVTTLKARPEPNEEFVQLLSL